MLARIAQLALAAPRRVVAFAVLGLIAAAIVDIPITHSLAAGGFQDPESQSARAAAVLANTFHQGDIQLILLLRSEDGFTEGGGSAARAAGTELAQQLAAAPHVTQVSSPWTSPTSPPAAAGMISRDGKSALIVVGIAGGDNDASGYAESLAKRFAHPPESVHGVTVDAGGAAAVSAQIKTQTETDLLRMESIAVPVSFVALVWVFGGLLAAALPIAVAAFAMLGSMAVLRAISLFTEVSIFALNVTLALGLALAVDYTLLIINRYRDELAAGHPGGEALGRTLATAGRTVLFSALTVALALSAMLLFPMYFLRSFAYAGVAAVALAAFASVLVAPAAIVLLGRRIDDFDVRRLARRVLRRSPAQCPSEQEFFYRTTRFVIRHTIPLGLAIVSVLIILGLPFLGVRWGFPDDRVLPSSSSARAVGDRLRSDFAVNWEARISVVLPDAGNVAMPELDRYAAQLSDVPDVSAVSAPSGTFVGGIRTGPPSGPTGLTDDRAFLTVDSSAEPFSAASTTQLNRLHRIAPPGDHPALFAGTAQFNRDNVDATTARLPLVLASIALITLGLLFLLTRSVVLPIKAVALNMLSLTATFGALVWVFQDGHLGAFGTTPTGTLVANIPVLMFCIAFGLSMDYEVFLLSRIREYRLTSGREHGEPMDNDECVAQGVAHTGRVITAAALLMAISFAALISAQVSFMRMFGAGLTIAVLVDATLVRLVLVPAFMHLFGRLNWWLPRPLARLGSGSTVTVAIPEEEIPGGNDVLNAGPH